MTRRRLLLLAPLGVVAAGAGAFWTVLRRMEEGSFDPRGVPSALVGKPLPPFELPAQPLDASNRRSSVIVQNLEPKPQELEKTDGKPETSAAPKDPRKRD